MTRRTFARGLPLVASGFASSAHADRGMHFTSGGQVIAVEWFAASGATKGVNAPALLLLHGADGLGYANTYRLGAGMLAAAGYHVAFPHYLDMTGERRVAYAGLRQNFPLWVQTVKDGVNWLADRPGVDPVRLGLVGISLGAALSLAVAADDRRVKAVVDYSGPLLDDLVERRPVLPPTLVLHGEDDRIVPVANARRLVALLAETSTVHESHIYSGQGHVFLGMAQLDAASRASSFLDRHLKGAQSAEDGRAGVVGGQRE